MKSKNFTATPAGDEQEKQQQQQKQIVRYLHFLFNNAAATAAAVAASAVNAAAQPATLDVRAQHVGERVSESVCVPKRASVRTHTYISTHSEGVELTEERSRLLQLQSRLRLLQLQVISLSFSLSLSGLSLRAHLCV